MVGFQPPRNCQMATRADARENKVGSRWSPHCPIVAQRTTASAQRNMSIYRQCKPDVCHELALAAETECFLCAEHIGKVAIHWMGATGDIYLHPHCALSLCRRLLQDCERYYSPSPEQPLDPTPLKP